MSVLSSHHTVWIQCEGSEPHPERYALDGDRLVAFGDRALAHVPDGSTVTASVHEIAGGPMVATFGARVRSSDGVAIDRQALLSLLDHVSLGRNAVEMERSIDHHSHRRVLVLEPVGPTP